MELRHLRYFIAVAEELHFRRAAERLHISQPPLSEQIASLEDELGVRLLERDRSRSVKLTAAGTAMLIEARKIMQQVEKTAEIVQRVSRGEVGTLSIGLAPAMSYGIVPQVLRQFRSELPGVSMQLSEMLTPEQESAIVSGALDVGFCYGSLQSDVLASECICREMFVLAVPDGHPAVTNAPVDLAEFQRESFIAIARSTSPGLFDRTVRACQSAGFSPKVTQQATQFQTAVGLVCVGMGVSLLPSSMSKLKREGVVYLTLADRTPYVETLIVRRAGNSYPAVERLVAIAKVTQWQ